MPSFHIKLAEAVRFELTELLHSLVFKTNAINRALPHFHYLARLQGIEPRFAVLETDVMPLYQRRVFGGLYWDRTSRARGGGFTVH